MSNYYAKLIHLAQKENTVDQSSTQERRFKLIDVRQNEFETNPAKTRWPVMMEHKASAFYSQKFLDLPSGACRTGKTLEFQPHEEGIVDSKSLATAKTCTREHKHIYSSLIT